MGESGCDLINMPNTVWKDSEKPRRTSVSRLGAHNKNRNEHFGMVDTNVTVC